MMKRFSYLVLFLMALAILATAACAKQAPVTTYDTGVSAVLRLYLAPESLSASLPEDGQLFHLNAKQESELIADLDSNGARMVANHEGNMAFGEEITLNSDTVRVELAARKIAANRVAFSGRCVDCPIDLEVEEVPADGDDAVDGAVADAQPVNDRFVILPESPMFGLVIGREASGQAILIVAHYGNDPGNL